MQGYDVVMIVGVRCCCVLCEMRVHWCVRCCCCCAFCVMRWSVWGSVRGGGGRGGGEGGRGGVGGGVCVSVGGWMSV